MTDPSPVSVQDIENLFATCPIAIAGTDATHRVRYCNAAFEQLFHYRNGEALGKELDALVGLGENQEAATALARVSKGEPIQLTTRVKRRDHSAVDVEFHVVPRSPKHPFTGYWALFHDITERRRAEHLLRVSRELFKKAFHASPVTIALSTSPENRWIDVNDTWLQLMGYTREAVIGRTPVEVGLYDREEFDRLNEQVRAHGGSLRNFECRLRASDGRVIIGLLSIEEFVAEKQAFRIVMIADVTALRQAEATLSKVTQNVIEAQEWERLRIARDLHDDIGQRLAVWQLEMDGLRRALTGSPPEIAARMHELQKQARSISADLQGLSRELHSPTLSLVSIDKSLKRLCHDVSARLGVDVEFTTTHVPRTIPSEVSLCLFRVLQEALTNAVKHSGTTRAVVRLAGTPGAIELKVRDFGSGLPADSAASTSGIGLLTMRERVAMVKGTFSIVSPAGGGTEIDIRIPLADETGIRRM